MLLGAPLSSDRRISAFECSNISLIYRSFTHRFEGVTFVQALHTFRAKLLLFLDPQKVLHIKVCRYLPICSCVLLEFFHRLRYIWYLCVIKNNLMHYLSSVYFFNQHLHVSGIFVAHHQEGQQRVNWKTQHVPIVVYIQYNSWSWATDMLETCRGWLTK